jgi:hypothetical protein
MNIQGRMKKCRNHLWLGARLLRQENQDNQHFYCSDHDMRWPALTACELTPVLEGTPLLLRCASEP